jgi:hypothetical protein
MPTHADHHIPYDEEMPRRTPRSSLVVMWGSAVAVIAIILFVVLMLRS